MKIFQSQSLKMTHSELDCNHVLHVCADYWQPRLARLDQSGYINAWIGRDSNSWIQVRCTHCYIILCWFQCALMRHLNGPNAHVRC